jgi:formamidopyrimidine-DNA glycosylase
LFELPEVVTLAGQMNEALRGRRVARASVISERPRFLFISPEPPAFETALAGCIFKRIASRGKWILAKLNDDRILLVGEFGGRLALQDRETPKGRVPHVLIEFEDGRALTLTIQMWAFVGLVTEEGLSAHPVAGSLGPSPLDPDFSIEQLSEVLDWTAATEDQPIKAFLTHEANVCGIGNGYLQDILWHARLSPKRKLSTLTREDRVALHGALRNMLERAMALRSRDTERDLYDQPGGYVPVLDRRAIGRPCPTCSTPIVKIAYLGGSCYLCPTCQIG